MFFLNDIIIKKYFLRQKDLEDLLDGCVSLTIFSVQYVAIPQDDQTHNNLCLFDKLTKLHSDGTLWPANNTFRETTTTILLDKIYLYGNAVNRPFVQQQIQRLERDTLNISSWILVNLLHYT